MELITRMRRLRENKILREMVSESDVKLKSLIQPLFIDESIDKRIRIESMPGIDRISISEAVKEAESIRKAGISSILLFGIPAHKDELAGSAWNDEGVIQRSVKLLKKETDMLIISDLCMCEYTSHGHCGVIKNSAILNDETLAIYQKIALSYARSGVDMIAPSGMMDGQVKAIRESLDDNGFKNIPIMAYSAKYESSLYAPFREAAESAPAFGDRSGYQMNYHNAKEALREVELDIKEGADIVMVKPALFYLDIIKMVKERFNVPVAAYNVSGEYSLVKAAAINGWIDENRMINELLTSIKRAGADLIITYFAKQFAEMHIEQ